MLVGSIMFGPVLTAQTFGANVGRYFQPDADGGGGGDGDGGDSARLVFGSGLVEDEIRCAPEFNSII